LRQKAKRTLESHLGWLQRHGMICNLEKTEMMVFNDRPGFEMIIDGKKVIAKDSMKVLGIIFDDTLSWTYQVKNVISKTNRIYHGLKHLRKLLSADQHKTATTAYYFSVLYYGAEVWYHKNLAFQLKQKIRSAHYRALRLIKKNPMTSRDELDQTCGRATPDEWADYVLAKMAAMTIIRGSPSRLFDDLMANSYTERRQDGRMFFFDGSKKKIGRQSIRNRLSVLSKQMKFKWLHTSTSALRPNLKKCFFQYVKNSDTIQKLK
jgi:hypothetical protein